MKMAPMMVTPTGELAAFQNRPQKDCSTVIRGDRRLNQSGIESTQAVPLMLSNRLPRTFGSA
jgi:hypothetical protein